MPRLAHDANCRFSKKIDPGLVSFLLVHAAFPPDVTPPPVLAHRLSCSAVIGDFDSTNEDSLLAKPFCRSRRELALFRLNVLLGFFEPSTGCTVATLEQAVEPVHLIPFGVTVNFESAEKSLFFPHHAEGSPGALFARGRLRAFPAHVDT